MTVAFPPRVIGHRGAAALAPENTRAGLRLAARLGASCAEFDVQLSADGVPVLFHDDTLDRTTNGSGPLAARRWTELSCLDAGSWFNPTFAGEPIPSLADALSLIAELGLDANIEMKGASVVETTRAALQIAGRLWPVSRRPPLVSSFSREALAEAARCRPDWPRGLLVEDCRGAGIDAAEALGCFSLHVGKAGLDKGSIRNAKARGLAVLAYTVNDPGEAGHLFTLGVDAVFSDHPDLVKAPLGIAEKNRSAESS